MDLKKDIRRQILEKRSEITNREWKERSHKIFERVVEHPFFLQANAIYCYVDYSNEVETRNIISHAWKHGKKVAVPKVMGDHMNFFYIHDFSDLQRGYKGILEPKECHLVKDENVLIIMPGAAFDRNCNRIGYGKGFYDKYLNSHPYMKTIALAFEIQIVDSIPTDSHDICPNIIITEEKIYDGRFTEGSNTVT